MAFMLSAYLLNISCNVNIWPGTNRPGQRVSVTQVPDVVVAGLIIAPQPCPMILKTLICSLLAEDIHVQKVRLKLSPTLFSAQSDQARKHPRNRETRAVQLSDVY